MILALSAWKGSGKDTLAKFLIENKGFRRIAFADVLKDMVAEQYGIPRSYLDIPEKKEQPVLSLQVNPQDDFSRMIAEYLVKEFASADGKKPSKFGYANMKFVGFFNKGQISDGLVLDEYPLVEGPSVTAPVFWTPRALAILEGSVKRSVNSKYWVQRALGSIKPGENVVITDMRYKSELAQVQEFSHSIQNEMKSIRINRFDSSPSTDPSERDLDNAAFDLTLENKGTPEELYLKTLKALEL